MKTRHLIGILRCPNDETCNCKKCEIRAACLELEGSNANFVVAERLEQLLDQLRVTEAELKEARSLAQTYEKRYNRFLHDMQEVIHEQEIISGYGR